MILNIRNVPKIGMIDMEADRAVIWVTKNEEADRVARELQAEGGSTSDQLEVYLAGHVVLRTRLSSRERGRIEADELFYDARRNVAVALQDPNGNANATV